jgi:hypothetical protein
MESSCEAPFWERPQDLFTHFNLKYKPQCRNQVWNFSIRILILSLVIGLVGMPLCGMTSMTVSIFFGAVVAFIIIMTSGSGFYPAKVVTAEETQLTPMASSYDIQEDMILREARREGVWHGGEGFTNPQNVSKKGMATRIVGLEAALPNVDIAPYSGPSLPDYTPPSARNPFMNILLDEYKYNPDRPPAVNSSNPAVKQTLDDYFRVQWFSDPTDVFGKNQSQRQFVTMPSTSIPNDQGSFADWLYKIPGKTCKEGGRTACLAGTDGGPVTWLNMDL